MTVLHWLAYSGFRIFETLLRLLPLPAVFLTGSALGTLAYYLAPGYRRLALRNIRTAYPDHPAPRKLARDAFSRLGANLLCGIKIAWMDSARASRHVEVEGSEIVRGVVEAGSGFVYAIPHMGCWELLAQVPETSPGLSERTSLYQPLSNRYLDRHVRYLRQRSGYRLFDRREGFRAPLEHLARGAGLGILVDQHAGDKGVWIPFFGRLASTSTLAALLSARSGCPIIPIGVITVGIARWKVVTHPPINPAGDVPTSSRNTDALTAAVAASTASLIDRSPADWFWVHRRWKTPQPNFLLTRYKRGIALHPGMSATDLKHFRVLLRSPNWLGDACMALPAVAAIRSGRPDLHLTVLAPENLAAFWERQPCADATIARPKSDSPLATARRIKACAPFDVAVLLPNSTRAALEAKLAGIPEIIGYRGSFRSRLLDTIVKPLPDPPGPPPHHVHHYLHLAARFGADTTAAVPKTYPARIAAPAAPRLGICPGAEYGPAKRWPAENFAEVARRAAEARPDLQVSIFGLAADSPFAQPIADALPPERCHDRTGQTSLAELMDELANCTVLLTNDTGTMHLAASLGIPVVAVFGSTEPAWTGPLGDGHTVLREHVECSPCFLRRCPIDFRCMRELDPDRVLDAVLAKL
ncbi:hypothetical protein BH23VER1_BH23VER1_21610 [soil metagenome]